MFHDCIRLMGNGDGSGNSIQVIIHNDAVGGLDGTVASNSSHGYSYVCTGQCRGIIDAVSNIHHCAFFLYLLNLIQLLQRQQLTVTLVHGKFFFGIFHNLLSVSTEDDEFLHSSFLQLFHNRLRFTLYFVGNDIDT